jgi:DNA-binding MarR family transcriptional regulator
MPKVAALPAPSADRDEDFALEDFLPYRLAVAAHTVSRALSSIYAERFDLSIAEWRVIANLGRFGPLSAGEIAAKSNLDKPKVTRALKRLADTGQILRAIVQGDRRQSRISLSRKGQGTYRSIAGLAQRWEQHLLAALDADDRRRFDQSLRVIEARARALAGQ